MKRKIGSWYFGWNIVIVTSIITMITVGTRMGASPFFKPMLESFEISRTALSAIFSISMFVYGIGMPIAGYLVERFSTRFVLLIGAGTIITSLLWTVFAKDILSFTISYGILLSIGLSFTSPIAVTPVVSKWFTRKRGKALFYLSTGSMGGIAIMNPAFTAMIEWVGWEATFLILAALFFLLIVPATWFIVRDEAPENTDLLPGEILNRKKNLSTELIPIQKWTEALSTRPFWQITFGLFVCGYSMNLLGSHGVTMLTDHGFTNHTSALGVGLIGLVAMISTVFLGELSDRYSKKKLLAMIYFFRGVGFFMLVLVMSTWQLYTVTAIAGIVWAGSTALSSAILGNVYGLRHLGLLYGLSYFVHQIGGTVSVFIAGWGYEVFGTHLLSFWSAAFLLALAAGVSLMLPGASYSKKLEKNLAQT